MKATKRILLFIDQLGSGGAERQLTYLAIGLKRAGYDVRLCYHYQGNLFYRADLENNDIELSYIPEAANIRKRPMVFLSIIRAYKPDCVITYLEGCSMGVCIARMFKRFPLIVSERNTSQSMTRRETIKFNLYRLADKVVPNSFSQARFIGTHAPYLRDKTEVITNTIDIEKFKPTEVCCQRRPVVLTMARIFRQKNIENYLKAIALLRNRRKLDVSFEWYGVIESEAYLDSVIRLKSELGLDDVVTFFPGGTSDAVGAYKQARYFCLPSLYEGFPNALCEAMACKLTCIASDVCDNPDILTDKERRFDPLNPEDIADKLEAMLSMASEQMLVEGRANRDRIKSMCSFNSFISAYKKTIDSIV